MAGRPDVTTMADLVAHRAATTGDRVAFTFAGRAHTFADLHAGAATAAGHLIRRGVEPGDRVVVALPNGPEFFAAFYGTLLAGGIAVPVYAVLGTDRIAAVAGLSGSRVVVLPADTDAHRIAAVASAGLDVVTAADLAADPAPVPLPPVDPDDVAFLQYTSGSTGDPKGVRITHANLLTNVAQMIEGMQIPPDERFVSWLPVCHDMGLILMTMVPLYLGTVVHLLPSSLRNVEAWLAAIEATGATYTGAPDFAYRVVLRRIDPEQHFDLSSLRIALNAAEPVRASTIARFEERFDLDGVMLPAYGLAEATVGVSMCPPGTRPRVDERGFVSAGLPFPGIALRSDGPDHGGVGELLFSSPATTAGYHGNPEETARVFGADGWVRTGDLGYVDGDGHVFIVGRSKNIIISGGRNLAPAEIEEIADGHPAVRRVAAVGIDRGGVEGEQPFVFAEVPGSHDADELHEMAVQIVARLHDSLGLRPALVCLLRPRTIPFTANGKIRHGALREAYLSGALGEALLYPPGPSPPAGLHAR